MSQSGLHCFWFQPKVIKPDVTYRQEPGKQGEHYSSGERKGQSGFNNLRIFVSVLMAVLPCLRVETIASIAKSIHPWILAMVTSWGDRQQRLTAEAQLNSNVILPND